MMRALSVRQPHAERIIQGAKRFENRSVPTKIRERIYVYASLTPDDGGESLQRGVIVGTVEVYDCTGAPGRYRWHLPTADEALAPPQASSASAAGLVQSIPMREKARVGAYRSARSS